MKVSPLNQRTIDEFRAKHGRGGGLWGDHLLLLTARGAHSVDEIITPLVYGRDGDDYMVVASMGGAPSHPAWFGNVQANPEVECDVAAGQGTDAFMARARVVQDRAERDWLFLMMSRVLAVVPGLRKADGATDSGRSPRANHQRLMNIFLRV